MVEEPGHFSATQGRYLARKSVPEPHVVEAWDRGSDVVVKLSEYRLARGVQAEGRLR